MATLVKQREQASDAKLVGAFENIIGVVERFTEYWVLPEGVEKFVTPDIDTGLLDEISQTVPEIAINYLEPLFFSRLQ
jgi:hypothetical protein